MITHYRSANCKTTPIASMVDEHLANAIANLARTGKDMAMLSALRQEQYARSRRGHQGG